MSHGRPDKQDRRQVIVHLTQSGASILRKLSIAHHQELEIAGPRLAKALRSIALQHGDEEKERGMTNAIRDAQELGDFTTDWRVIPISLLAIAIGLISSVVAWVLLRLIGLFTNLVLLPSLGHGAGVAGWKYAGRVGSPGAGRRGAGDRSDGALRVGTNSRARHSGGDRIDPDQRQPRCSRGWRF